MMGESRTELLAWINNLLHVGYTKIEQFGSGAAHCQIIDSIYRDVPLSKVKFNAKHEYEYVSNFKVLQSAFDRHKIENHIPVDRLIKCKFQDNLEFLQLMKKIWDQAYPGGTYDALGRRKGASTGNISGSQSILNKSISSLSKRETFSSSSSVNKGTTKSANPNASLAALDREKQQVISEYETLLSNSKEEIINLNHIKDQTEREKEFYYSKLREIEEYIQISLESMDKPDVETALKHIQSIMYKTEDGFEVPENEVDTVF